MRTGRPPQTLKGREAANRGDRGSDGLLKNGHSYYVRVNDNTRNPRIVRVFRELPMASRRTDPS